MDKEKAEFDEEVKKDASGREIPSTPASTAVSETASSSSKGPNPAVQYTKQIRLKRNYMSECKDD